MSDPMPSERSQRLVDAYGDKAYMDRWDTEEEKALLAHLAHLEAQVERARDVLEGLFDGEGEYGGSFADKVVRIFHDDGDPVGADIALNHFNRTRRALQDMEVGDE